MLKDIACVEPAYKDNGCHIPYQNQEERDQDHESYKENPIHDCSLIAVPFPGGSDGIRDIDGLPCWNADRVNGASRRRRCDACSSSTNGYDGQRSSCYMNFAIDA